MDQFYGDYLVHGEPGARTREAFEEDPYVNEKEIWTDSVDTQATTWLAMQVLALRWRRGGDDMVAEGEAHQYQRILVVKGLDQI